MSLTQPQETESKSSGWFAYVISLAIGGFIFRLLGWHIASNVFYWAVGIAVFRLLALRCLSHHP